MSNQPTKPIELNPCKCGGLSETETEPSYKLLVRIKCLKCLGVTSWRVRLSDAAEEWNTLNPFPAPVAQPNPAPAEEVGRIINDTHVEELTKALSSQAARINELEKENKTLREQLNGLVEAASEYMNASLVQDKPGEESETKLQSTLAAIKPEVKA